MITIENAVLPSADQWKAVISGCRNPMNSWNKSDSKMCNAVSHSRKILPGVEETCYDPCEPYISIGENDLTLMKKLSNAGTDHHKFMRMITVYVDITAPLYWWKEFDTYKVGTVANSCSTMHKIADKEFTLADFSCEHLAYIYLDEFRCVIDVLNNAREMYLWAREEKEPLVAAKDYWWQMIQLLPSSYNQRRTVMLNYAVLKNIYHARKNHKLDEWHTFCDWIETLPYAKELIIGE